MTRDEMIAEVEKINGAKFDAGNETEQAILFLVAAAVHGTTSYSRIQGLTGLSIETCRKFGKRARKDNSLFVGHKIAGRQWLDPEDGGMAMVCDALCLSGMLERVPA